MTGATGSLGGNLSPIKVRSIILSMRSRARSGALVLLVMGVLFLPYPLAVIGLMPWKIFDMSIVFSFFSTIN